MIFIVNRSYHLKQFKQLKLKMGKCLSILASEEPVNTPNNIQPNESVPIERPELIVEPHNNHQPAIDLSKVDPNTVSDAPFKDQIITAFLFDCHDGDTIKVLVNVNGVLLKFSLRLLGIDTPEIMAGAGKLPEEKLAAIKARDYLASLLNFHNKETQRDLSDGNNDNNQEGERKLVNKEINNVPIKIKLTDCDKFGGRYLGYAYDANGKSVVDSLIEKGYGRPYHGEKKNPWTLKELTSPPFV